MQKGIIRILVITLLVISGRRLNPGPIMLEPHIPQPPVLMFILSLVTFIPTSGDDHCLLYGLSLLILAYLRISMLESLIVTYLLRELHTNSVCCSPYIRSIPDIFFQQLNIFCNTFSHNFDAVTILPDVASKAFQLYIIGLQNEALPWHIYPFNIFKINHQYLSYIILFLN